MALLDDSLVLCTEINNECNMVHPLTHHFNINFVLWHVFLSLLGAETTKTRLRELFPKMICMALSHSG